MGAKGKRFALPNARVMIHQGSAGFRGNVPDIEVAARETLTLTTKLTEILALHTGQPFEKVKRDTERDYYMTAQDAKEYGIVDEVLESSKLAACERTGRSTTENGTRRSSAQGTFFRAGQGRCGYQSRPVRPFNSRLMDVVDLVASRDRDVHRRHGNILEVSWCITDARSATRARKKSAD